MTKSKWVLSCWVVMALGSAVCAQRLSFNAPMMYSTPYGPEAVATGDFNGDGKPDLAVSTYGGSVAILLGAGGGIFRPGPTISISSTILSSIAVGDFNRDGKPDLAVVVDGAGVSILLGNGDGTFQPPVNYSVGPPYGLTIGDFNHDGKPDLAVGTGSGIAVLLGNGDGTFREPVISDTGISFQFLAAGDFNHDGKLDLAAGNYTTNSVFVLLGNGNGTFQTPANLTVAQPVSLAVADFNGDGNPDLAVASANSSSTPGSVSILLGNGNGTFQAPLVTTIQSNVYSLVVADFNSDGKPDLAVAITSGVAILLGVGNGTFAPAVDYLVATGAMAAADFNGDHYPDLAIASYNSVVSILLNSHLGTFPEIAQYSEPGMYGASQIAVADLNHDGKLDLVTANAPNATVMLGNGDGAFQAPVNYPAGKFPNSITIADFNGDGNLDLALTDVDAGVWILLGNGDGTFQAAKSFPAGLYPIAVAAGDLNHDGTIDLVVANSGPGEPHISVLLGNGDGTFQPPIATHIGGSPYSLVVADFNGDGLADVAVANLHPGSVGILIGNGDGTFRPPVLYGVPAPAGAPDALALGDFNRDGKPDLAVAIHGHYAGVSVLLGNGDGSFAAPVFYPATLPEASDWWTGGVAVADFNGDGFPDIASISGGIAVSVLTGNGDGTFMHARFFGTGVAYFLAAGDFTGDGKPDLAMTGGVTLSILINTTK